MPMIANPEAGREITVENPARQARDPLKGAFFWLSLFYFVYCARPEDWVPGLLYIPLAKITGIFAILALFSSWGKATRKPKDLPREGLYLFLLICLLFASAIFSPVWKGGAFFHTLDFSKVFIIWLLTVMIITDMRRFKRIAFIQTASVAAIALISPIKGHGRPRLEGALRGIYGNPNDLAFAIVLTLPFALAFLLQARGPLRKGVWMGSMLLMFACLFMTASRAGFITLLISGAVCLWHFAIKGRRAYLIAVAALVVLVVGAVAGGKLKDRFLAISGKGLDTGLETSAHGSYEQRRELIVDSLQCMARYPILGIGVHNFTSYTAAWREVHMAYLQIGAEGGIPGLVLYLLFFWRGFTNLRKLRKMRDLDPEIKLFAGALHSSLVGFAVGALFAPEAYQFFPFFTVAYTAVLLFLAQEIHARKAPKDSRQKVEMYAMPGGTGFSYAGR
jgi:O-antigen ligase